MQDLTPAGLAINAIAQASTGGQTLQVEGTRLKSARTTILEQPGFEMGRSGRSFYGGIQVVAAGIVPVVDLPTTTAPIVVYNAGVPSPVNRLLHLKTVSIFYASGTAGVDGVGIFCGVTSAPLATALTANAANCKVQGSRPVQTSIAFIGLAVTVVASAWIVLDGTAVGAAAVTGLCRTVDVSKLGFVVPPTYAFVAGGLGDTGTTAKYGFGFAWDEIEAD